MSSTLNRADEWSEDLHQAILSQAFIARYSNSSPKSSSSASHPLLIKCLPHKPSKTLAIVVLPLQTLTPLFEGLAFRTLHRRIKSQPSLLSDQDDDDDEDALFDEIAYRVSAALKQTGGASDGTTEYWIDAELMRGEATLSINCKDATSSFSLDLDLTALDREEGPRFLRDHLVLPMASLSSFALGGSGVAQDVDEHARGAANADVVGQLLSRQGTGFSRYCRLFHGEADEIETTTPKQKTPPAKASTPKPETKTKTKTPDSGTDDDDDDDLVIFRPTQTPSSHHHTPQSKNSASSPRDDRSRRRIRLQSTTPTPIAPPSETASRSGKLMPGVAYTGQHFGPSTRSKARSADGDDSDEEEEMLVGAASQLKKDHTTSTSNDNEAQSASAAIDAAKEDKEQQSAAPTTDLVTQTQRVSLSPAPSTQDKSSTTPEPAVDTAAEPAPTTSSTARTSASSTSTSTPRRAPATTSTRGASSYQRGLAKRKRI